MTRADGTDGVDRETPRADGARGSGWEGLQEHAGALRRFLASRGCDDAEIDDVVQETFVRAARFRGGLTAAERLRPWLLRIAANVHTDRLRRERRVGRYRREATVEGLAELPEVRPEESLWRVDGVLLDDREALGVLRDALGHLAVHDRTLLESFYSSGSTEATARACEVPRSLVKTRLFRARRRLYRVFRSEVERRRGLGVSR